jgi:hypothetical protein
MDRTISLLATLTISATLTLGQQAPPGVCPLQQQEGFMNSWSGQTGTPDHSETRSVAKGTWFACLAFAGTIKPVAPACKLSFDAGDVLDIPFRGTATAKQSGNATLTCVGKKPTCCKVQVVDNLNEPSSGEKAALQTLQPKKEAKTAGRVISSTTDANGNQHPGSAAVSGPSSVTCISASGQNPGTYTPSCFIVAPGYGGIVNKGNTIGTSGAGTVTLTCNGQVPLSCSASIQ